MLDSKLNISTLVYMLNTNIRIDPNKLENIFDDIEPIDYNKPEEGVIRIAVRGKTKGLCKKLVFRRSYTESNQVKNFRNQVSFYVRILDKMPIYLSKVNFNKKDGFFSKDLSSENITNDIFRFRKGQTAFQFNKLFIRFNGKVNVGYPLRIFTSVTRKSQENQLINISYKLTNDDVKNGQACFEFEKGCYAHTLYIESEIDISVDINFVVEVNMFVFTSGKIKIAGCTREYQIDCAMSVLLNHMEKNLQKEQIQELFGNELDSLKIVSKNPVMINSDFASNYEIKRYELDSLIRSKYNVMSSFEPCTHPAVIIKYYHNSSYNESNGRCNCPKLYGTPHLCTGRGVGFGKGGCKTVTILVFQSGKVILTGGRELQQVDDGYKFIQNVLISNEHELRRI